MPYGQINYPQNLGTGPSVDTIADVGCFLTSFCNLLERFGQPVDPPTLNNFFIAHGTYLADGPNRDWLSWGSISAYNGKIVATQVGKAGWPPTNDAIVKFVYKSRTSGASITHFCLVVDHNAGTILDAWDGHVKHSPYGNPVAWATYTTQRAQSVAPPPPRTTPAFTVERIGSKTMQFKKNTNLWDLNQRSWPGMVNNPANSVLGGATFQTSRIARHMLTGSYYMPDGDETHGYNVVDCQDYSVPKPIPAPVPTAPPAAPVRPGGNPDNKYTVIKTLPGYVTATNAGNHVNVASKVKAGEYFVYNVHARNANLINVTSKLGQPGSWINKVDNVPDAPPPPPPAPEPIAAPAPPAPEPVPVNTVIETAPVDSTVAVPWRDTFVAFPKAIRYVATRDIKVEDLSGQQPDMPLQRYNPGVSDVQGVVSAFGTVTKEGVEYYRLKTNNDPDFNYWYGVPKIDQNTHTPNLLVKPNTALPVNKYTVARDSITLSRSKLETELGNFFDILPKWLKK